MPIDQRGEATRLASGPARRDASVDRARSTGDAEAKASRTTSRSGAGEDDANRPPLMARDTRHTADIVG